MAKASSKTGEDLHGAARAGDLIAVQRICSLNPLSINSRDKHSRTPLHLAAWSGQAEVVNYLCKNKADVGASAMDDMAAIHFASQKGHLEVVKTLVSFGVSTKSFNRKGMTALHYAVQGSYKELAKYLIKKGSSLSTTNKTGKTPLDLANSEDLRTFLAEYEKELKKEGDSSKSEKEVEANLDSVEKEVEEKDESMKRKGGDEFIDEELVKVKKTKVALNHLLASDDTNEDERGEEETS